MIGMIGLVFGGASAFGGFFTQHYMIGAAGVLLAIVSGIAIDNMIDPVE
jgi:hypothetical protein